MEKRPLRLTKSANFSFPFCEKSVIARSEATWQSPGRIHRNAVQKQTWYREIPTGLPALGMTSKFATASNHRVIARSGATWQSPGTIHRSAQQKQTWYREIPTGLTALGMTSKFATAPNYRVIARSEAEWRPEREARGSTLGVQSVSPRPRDTLRKF